MPLVVLMGSSGQSRDILDAILAAGTPVEGLLWDDAPAVALYGSPVLGGLDDWADHAAPGVEFVVALGDPERRGAYGDAMVAGGGVLASVIHARAAVSAQATLGLGVAVMAGVNISPAATIGDYVVLNANCSVDHDCVLERGVQFGPGVTLAGRADRGARGGRGGRRGHPGRATRGEGGGQPGEGAGVRGDRATPHREDRPSHSATRLGSPCLAPSAHSVVAEGDGAVPQPSNGPE